MGDRYYLELDCAYCGHRDVDVYYAPTCGFSTFLCPKCKKHNFIAPDFTSKKVEDVGDQEVIDGFFQATSVNWADREETEKINAGCKREAEDIRRMNE